ncbi:hypothetical protein [Demequina sp. NBRC 110055]|uniref:hypothetical protein n=1 Tax=Demequina sp. NBRC 110055 TaxID=1570344 RepID=UPI000A075B0F|nr:hypothetical protein [Demequina sp. NBRC 110055]
MTFARAREVVSFALNGHAPRWAEALLTTVMVGLFACWAVTWLVDPSPAWADAALDRVWWIMIPTLVVYSAAALAAAWGATASATPTQAPQESGEYARRS